MTNEKLTVQVGLTPELRDHIDTAAEAAAGGARETINELRRNLRAAADEHAKEHAKAEGLAERLDQISRCRTIVLRRDDEGLWTIFDYRTGASDQASDRLEDSEMLYALGAIVRDPYGSAREMNVGYSELRMRLDRERRAKRDMSAQIKGDQERIKELRQAFDDVRARLERAELNAEIAQAQAQAWKGVDQGLVNRALHALGMSGDGLSDRINRLAERVIKDDEIDAALAEMQDGVTFGGTPFTVDVRERDYLKVHVDTITSLAELRNGETLTAVRALRALSRFCERSGSSVASVQMPDGSVLPVVDFLATLDGASFTTAETVEAQANALAESSGVETTRVCFNGHFELPYADVLRLAKIFDARREGSTGKSYDELLRDLSVTETEATPTDEPRPAFVPDSHLSDAKIVFDLLGRRHLPLHWLEAVSPEKLQEVYEWRTGARAIGECGDLMRVLALAGEQIALAHALFDPGKDQHVDGVVRISIAHALRSMGWRIPDHDEQLWCAPLCHELHEFLQKGRGAEMPEFIANRYEFTSGVDRAAESEVGSAGIRMDDEAADDAANGRGTT